MLFLMSSDSLFVIIVVCCSVCSLKLLLLLLLSLYKMFLLEICTKSSVVCMYRILSPVWLRASCFTLRSYCITARLTSRHAWNMDVGPTFRVHKCYSHRLALTEM